MAIDLSKVEKLNAPTLQKDYLKQVTDFLSRDISFSGSALNDKKKEAFFIELSILFAAGVDIKTSLELIEEEQVKAKEKQLVTDIKEAIINGATLSGALHKTGKFSAYEFYSIQIGEETGKLAEVLEGLAAFYASKIKQSRQIISALSYPILVLATSVGAILFMMNFVVPMFSDIFKSFKGELPAITRIILLLSAAIGKYFYLFVLFVIAIFIVVATQHKKVWFRKYVTKAILKLPLFGPIISKIYIARFCHSMALLVGSRIPIIRTIRLIKQMINFYPIEISLDQVEEDLLRGVPLHKSIARFDIYPKRMVSLVKVGEEVNQMEQFFEKIGKQYTEEVEHQTSLIGSFIEPLMIIFLGLVVGTILIAMYLPLFSIGRMMG